MAAPTQGCISCLRVFRPPPLTLLCSGCITARARARAPSPQAFFAAHPWVAVIYFTMVIGVCAGFGYIIYDGVSQKARMQAKTK